MKSPETKRVAFSDTTKIIRPDDLDSNLHDDHLDRHLHEFDTELASAESSESFSGLQLRKLRRSRGLNQAQLAELLGVTQPNISRWEAGFEPTPLRLRERLKDILTGHNRNAGEFFCRTAKSDPSLSAFECKQFSLPIIDLSAGMAQLLPRPADTYVGKDFRRVFKTEWLDDLFDDRPLTDFALIHINHDLVPEDAGPNISPKRVDALLYVFQPEAGVPMLLINGYFSKSTGEPARLVHAITVDDV